MRAQCSALPSLIILGCMSQSFSAARFALTCLYAEGEGATAMGTGRTAITGRTSFAGQM
jgi:hypothetical protein